MTTLALLLATWFGSFSDTDSDIPDDAIFEMEDVFQLEFATDPRIHPSGERIVFVRQFMDIMADRRRSNLWSVAYDGSDLRPLTSGNVNHGSPRWAPDGNRLLYVANDDGSAQLWVRYMDTGQTAKLTRLPFSPSSLTWSPDGKWIAFLMHVPASPQPMAKMPSPPEGAQWADPPIVIESMIYRSDGAGYLPLGRTHVFVVPSDGGTPRQLTAGDFDHRTALSWSPDSESLVLSTNRDPQWEDHPVESEIFELRIQDRQMTRLTKRKGPDNSATLSPDGTRIAYLGFDDRYQGYQITKLSVMNRDGSGSRVLTGSLDRSVANPVWSADGKSLYFQYADRGNTKIARINLESSAIDILAENLGGTSIGRPYSGGSFTVSTNGRIAYTYSRPDHPADVATLEGRLTHLNDDLFAHKTLSKVTEMWTESSHDNRRIQGWVAYPPNFDASKTYPMILEIHGGPFANYGDRFSAEVQLFAAQGYVVLYMNPRGSSSYGEEFGNLIHHNYPGQDYDDLMSGVDDLLKGGFIDPNRLYVTGGSGGGVLTSWIVGKTSRFRAAVVAKPVINWTSFALTADSYNFFHQYWFSGAPWEKPEEYWRRSPLAYVGNVTTPTMLLTGELDYRTPISESEQYYQALKLCGVDTAMVRIPGASHGIAARPSQLIAKVAHIVAWFERYKESPMEKAQ